MHTEEGKNHKTVNNLLDENGSTWNRGLTKDSDDRVRKNTEATTKTLRQKVKDGTYIPPIMSEEARKRLSERQSLNNSGGKCKWYVVDGKNVQGTWERDLAIKMTEFGIGWDRINQPIKYTIGDKIKPYTPDFFLLEENLILEVKGYWWGNDEEKMKLILQQHDNIGHNLKLIFKDKFRELITCSKREEFLICLRETVSLKNYYEKRN